MAAPSTSTAGPSTSTTRRSYLTPKPTAIAQGKISIDHPQLRDLLVCPHERGLVSYLEDNAIVEQNLLAPGAPKRTLATLPFTPSSLTALALGPNDEDTLYAAGGSWNAELHLSYHRSGSETASTRTSTPSSPSTASSSSSSPISSWRDRSTPSTRSWQRDMRLQGTLNNSVLLTKNHFGGSEPRVGVTNNDCTFRMYDCAVRTNGYPEGQGHSSFDDDDDDLESPARRVSPLKCVGGLTLDTCINFATISPSGRTLLNVGDSPNLYLHDISGSARLSFYPICVLPIPVPTSPPPHYPQERPSTFTASFSASFSSNSMHFAVGSQEGVVAVWDLRYARKAVAEWQVDKMRDMGEGGMGAANGDISWDPSDWFHSRAPAWSVRNVKFVGGNRADGKEYLVFTEHTGLMHIIDAKTFQHEEIVRVPARMADPQPPTPPMYTPEPPQSPLSYIQLGIPASCLAVGPVGFNEEDAGDASLEGEEAIRRAWRRRRASLDWDVGQGGHADEDDVDGYEVDEKMEVDMDLDGDGDVLSSSLLLEEFSSNAHSHSGIQLRPGRRADSMTNLGGRFDSLATVSTSPLVLPRHSSYATPSTLGSLSTHPSSLTIGVPASRRHHLSPLKRARATHRASAQSKTHLSKQVKHSIYARRDPKYIISDGYAFPSATAELDYRVRNVEDEVSDESSSANGSRGGALDIGDSSWTLMSRWMLCSWETLERRCGLTLRCVLLLSRDSLS